MNTPHNLTRIVATALLSGGVAAVAGLALGAGTAQAFNYPVGVCNDAHHVCSYQWCPGMPLPFTGGANNPPNWDMGICHHFMEGMIGPSSPDWVKGNGNHAVGPMLIEGDPLPSPGVGPCQGVFPCLPGL